MPPKLVIGQEKDSESPKVINSPWLTRTLEGLILVIGLLIALTLRWGVYEPATIISRSMVPQFQLNDTVLLDHRASLHGSWQRGDVVLFNVPDTWKIDELDEDTLYKRVIGLPGETVSFGHDSVYINGQPLSEPYIAEPGKTFYSELSITLGDGQYFVMGDNRNDSADSRDYGPVPDQDIVGRATMWLAPLARMGRVPHPTYNLALQNNAAPSG